MPTPTYTGPSIVDYLSSVGKASDYNSRAQLASQYGISNYTGSAAQNTQLLTSLRSGSSGAGSTSGSTAGVPRNYTDYSQFNPTANPGGSLPTRPAGMSDADYAAYVKQSPFLVGDSNSATGYSSPTQAQINQNAATFAPKFWGGLPFDITSIAPTAAVKTAQSNPQTPGLNGIDGMMAYYDSLFKTSKSKADNLKAQEDAQRALQTSQTKPYLDKLMGSQSPDQVRQAATAQTGIDPTQYFAQEKAQIAEIGSLNERYNGLVAARDGQIATTQDKFASTNFISNQIAQINRNAAPELNRLSADINAKAAVLQASQGMFAEAQKFVNQAVDAATADLKYNFDMYNEFYNQNQDIIDKLDTKYQTAYKDAMGAAEKEYSYAQDQKTKVANLMLDNPQASISISDSLDQALEKIQKTPKTTGSTVGSAESGYQNVVRDAQGNVIKTSPITTPSGGGSGGLTPTQIRDGSVRAGLDISAFKGLPTDVQNFFNQTSDANIGSLKDELTKVSDGSQKAADFSKWVDKQSYSTSVKTFLKSQATQAEKAAPPPQPGFLSRLWNSIF